MSRFSVTFEGKPPESVKVGDELVISGKVTVHSITAALVDVTSYGADQTYLPGEVSFDLFSNNLTVERV